nr:TraA family conjugative transfer protein [Aeromonas dhakensis]
MNENQLANASSKNNTLFLLLGVMVVSFLMLPDQAHAGTGGAAFEDVWVTLKDWTQGTLGRIVAGAMILVGVIGGIARQSLMAFAMGIGGGMGLYNSPVVVESIMSATLGIEQAGRIVIGISSLSNGLS